jgi:hypothetical protein
MIEYPYTKKACIWLGFLAGLIPGLLLVALAAYVLRRHC